MFSVPLNTVISTWFLGCFSFNKRQIAVFAVFKSDVQAPPKCRRVQSHWKRRWDSKRCISISLTASLISRFQSTMLVSLSLTMILGFPLQFSKRDRINISAQSISDFQIKCSCYRNADASHLFSRWQPTATSRGPKKYIQLNVKRGWRSARRYHGRFSILGVISLPFVTRHSWQNRHIFPTKVPPLMIKNLWRKLLTTVSCSICSFFRC